MHTDYEGATTTSTSSASHASPPLTLKAPGARSGAAAGELDRTRQYGETADGITATLTSASSSFTPEPVPPVSSSSHPGVGSREDEDGVPVDVGGAHAAAGPAAVDAVTTAAVGVDLGGGAMEGIDQHAGTIFAERLKTILSAEDLVEMAVIGRGQHGQVVRALHLPTLCMLAVKKINVFRTGGRRQLVKELLAYAKLSSPYIVPLLGAFYDEGSIVLASEYMDMGDLKRYVSRYGPMPDPLLRHVVRQALLGLHYLHASYQIHRDIKPDNILVDHRGRVKIADFGLLKELRSTLSETTSFLGTLAYLSPERLTSKAYSYSADMWSMGLVVYFCATGRPAFPNANYWQVLDSLTHNGAPTLNPTKYSPALCSLVHCMLRRDPAKRWTAARLLTEHPFFVDPPAGTPSDEEIVQTYFKDRFVPEGVPTTAVPPSTTASTTSSTTAVTTPSDVSAPGAGPSSSLTTPHSCLGGFVDPDGTPEYLRAVDVVVEAHFHGLLRIPRDSIPNEVLLVMRTKELKRRRKEAHRLRHIAKRLGTPEARAAAAEAVALFRQEEAAVAALAAGHPEPVDAEAGPDSGYLWVQGYRPLLPEDSVRFQRIADIYGVPVDVVEAAFEAALAKRRAAARGLEVVISV